jgi:5-deoxy-glucuronate isomerase
MFSYIKFDKNNEKNVCKQGGLNAEMLMDISVKKLEKGQKISFLDGENETALLLVLGKVEVKFNGKKEVFERGCFLNDIARCLHFCKNTSVEVEAVENSEILIQQTKNERAFAPVVYGKHNIRLSTACKDKWEGVAVRNIVNIIDFEVAPYSNLVLGETNVPQGRWWSYPPHGHPQPEVYYYRFLKEQGFGACFVGGQAHTVKDGSFAMFSGGLSHPQVTAPGYPMYCAWMIRHLEGDPWLSTRVVDKGHEWLD